MDCVPQRTHSHLFRRKRHPGITANRTATQCCPDPVHGKDVETTLQSVHRCATHPTHSPRPLCFVFPLPSKTQTPGAPSYLHLLTTAQAPSSVLWLHSLCALLNTHAIITFCCRFMSKLFPAVIGFAHCFE